MVLWSKFITPRKPYKLRLDKRRLQISEAFLGKRRGPSNSDYVVQCAIGSHPPFKVCTLWNGRSWYLLNLEFEDREDVVFSVDGPYGVNLVGHYIPLRATSSGTSATDELQVDFCGQDISTEDIDVMREYIPSDGAAMKGHELDMGRQLYQKSNQKREVPDTYTDRSNEKNVPVIVSTELDSCPTKKKRRAERKMVDVPVDSRSKSSKDINESAMPSKISKLSDGLTVEVLVDGNQDGKEASPGKQASPTKKKRRAERKMRDVPVDGRGTSSKDINESAMSSKISKLSDGSTVEVLEEGNQDGKEASRGKQVSPTKKKRRAERKMRDVPVDGRSTSSKDINESSMSSKISKLSHGMTVEVLEKGNQDWKKASRGKQVEIYFNAKLCSTGRILGSNIDDDAPYQILLGHEKLLKGVNIGIEGMRVGEKRRLIIPPSLSCSSENKAKLAVDPDEWIQFDVELVGVCD